MSQIIHPFGGIGSIVIDDPLWIPRESFHPTVDGYGVIQQMGGKWEWVWRLIWMTTPEIQTQIDAFLEMAKDGWFIVEQTPQRSPVADPLDYYFMKVTLWKYSATKS